MEQSGPFAFTRLQWGHGGEAVETPPSLARRMRSRSFNGATAVKPWRQSHPHSRRNETMRFNGATAVKPWRRGGARRAPHP